MSEVQQKREGEGAGSGSKTTPTHVTPTTASSAIESVSRDVE